MEERASGIILRTRPLTETSLIVQWITREQGRVATVAKGARRPTSPFVGKLDLLYEADFSFVRSRRSELHTLREVILRGTNAALRRDLNRLSAGAYLTILLEQGTERETPLPAYYDLLTEALRFLSEHSPNLTFVFALEAKFLALSGTTPSPDELPSPIRDLLTRLEEEQFQETPLPSEALRPLWGVLQRGIGTTLEKLPPQRERLIRAIRR